MKYLISGSVSPFYKDGSFFKFFEDNNAKNVLVICAHHTTGELSAYDRLLSNVPEDCEIDFVLGNFNFIKDLKDLNDFDGVYITGGLMEHLIYYLRSSGIDQKLKNFLLNKSKVYVGASAGALLFTEYFFTESEMDLMHIARLSDEGFDLIPNTLIDVHFGEPGNEQIMLDRTTEFLKNHPEINEAWLMDADCCIEVVPNTTEYKIIKGNLDIIKNNQ